MKTTITTLVDNRLEPPLLSEHGLAFLIEHNNKRILFDTGQGEVLFHNARTLGVALTGLDFLILSHGHYDHGGNIAAIIKLNPSIVVVAHPSCTIPRYSIHADRTPSVTQIGLTTPNKQALIGLNYTQHIWCTTPKEIIEGLWVTGEIPRTTSFEDTGGPFFLDSEGTNKDTLPDDIALWIEQPPSTTSNIGATLVVGCCHSGIVNTLEHIKNIGGQKPSQIIGGLHLLHATTKRLDATLNYFKANAITDITPLHCSGEKAIELLKSSTKTV